MAYVNKLQNISMSIIHSDIFCKFMRKTKKDKEIYYYCKLNIENAVLLFRIILKYISTGELELTEIRTEKGVFTFRKGIENLILHTYEDYNNYTTIFRVNNFMLHNMIEKLGDKIHELKEVKLKQLIANNK